MLPRATLSLRQASSRSGEEELCRRARSGCAWRQDTVKPRNAIEFSSNHNRSQFNAIIAGMRPDPLVTLFHLNRCRCCWSLLRGLTWLRDLGEVEMNIAVDEYGQLGSFGKRAVVAMHEQEERRRHNRHIERQRGDSG